MHQPELYARSNAVTLEHTSRQLREVVPKLRWTCEARAGERAAALDVGCGTGNVTADVLLPSLPQSVRLLLGHDVNAHMVQHAAREFAGCERLRFVQGDIADRDLAAAPLGREAAALGGFCKVFSFYALNWVQDQRQALSNIHHLLRPGGEAVLALAAHEPLFSAYLALRSHPRWGEYMEDAEEFVSPYHGCSDAAAAFSASLKEAGFSVLQCDCRLMHHRHASPQKLRDLVVAVNPFLHRVPAEKKDPFISAILSELKKYVEEMLKNNENKSDQDNTTFYYSLLIAHVEKNYVS